jgi:hypothetical protein
MLILPIEFDENEWFVIIVIVLLVSLFIFTRKILPFAMIVAILVYFATIGKWTDYVIGIKLQRYLALDTFKQDLFDWLSLEIAYPLVGYFFVYFLIRWKIKGIITLLYIVVWSILLTFSEWISSLFHVFIYFRWNLIYSFVIYFFVLSLGFLYLKLIQRLYDSYIKS